ncbi:MAG: hypothetical protein K2G89_08545 [Lachnospiraceae bacterium]|nr:hypothetical protein [Lachnospiraceae bacterium]
MDSRNLEKALDIYSKLIVGEEIKKGHKENGHLYDEYFQNAEVYEITGMILKKLNLTMYEYQDALFITAGEGNHVFGYTNEELKRMMGLRYNKELYLCYFIMYHVLLSFYNDSAAYQFQEFIRLETVLDEVSKSLTGILKELSIYNMNEVEENSFKTIALLWDELPAMSGEDRDRLRASRSSRAGLCKLTFNFLLSQDLFIEVEERYYPTDRFKALVENYFEEYRGRLYEVLNRPLASGEDKE